MIKYISIILATGIVVVTGCKPSSEKEIVEMPVLRASSLFNDDSVYTYLHLYEDIHGATSNYYIEKAEAIAESNPQKAIYYYKRSLTVHPSYGIYKKLGGLLMKEGMYSEADRVYSFITRKAYTQSLMVLKMIIYFKLRMRICIMSICWRLPYQPDILITTLCTKLRI
jgi:hypothetical protein